MDIKLTILFFLSSTVTFLSLSFSAVYFWNNFKLGIDRRLLGFVFFCFGFIFLTQHLKINFSTYLFPHLFRTGPIAGIIAISLLYILIKRQITNSGWHKIYLLHAIPLLIYLVNFYPFFIQSASKKQELLKEIDSLDGFYLYNEGLFNQPNIYILFTLLFLFYFFLSVKLYINYKKQFNKKAACMVMLKRYILVLSIIFLVVALYYFELLTFKSSYYIHVAYYILSLIVLLYLFFDYKFFFNQFFSEEIKKNEIQLLNKNALNKQLTTLDELQNGKKSCNKILINLENYLKESENYLNSNFSIKLLEQGSGISAYKISKCIKKVYKINFNQYINAWRIQYLIDHLDKNKKIRNYNIESLGATIGFNSSSSFYSSFKANTGLTPREFIDRIIEKDQKDSL